MVEVHLVDGHDPVHGAPEEIDDALNHGLLFQTLLVLAGGLGGGSRVLSVEGGEGVVVDDRNEEGKGRKGQLAVLLYKLKHGLDVGFAGDHLYHLFAVNYQVVLVDGLYQHRAEVLDDCAAVGAPPPALLSHLLEYRLQDLHLGCQLLGLRMHVFIDIEVEVELDGVGNGHAVGVLDQPLEVPGVAVYAVNGLLVLVIEEGEVGPEEVASQEGQHLAPLEHPEEQIKVENILLLCLLEEPVEDTGGLGLHQFDGLLGEFELPLVGVGGQGRHCDVGDGLGYECGGVRDVIE